MRRSEGFTLIELMVVLVLVAMLLVGVSGLLLSNLRGGGKATVLANLRDEGDAAILAMERELRFGNNPVCLNGGDRLRFQLRTRNENGTYATRDVCYEFSGGALGRGVPNASGCASKTNLLGGDEIAFSKISTIPLFSCTIPTSSLAGFQSTVVNISFLLTSNEDSKVQQQFQTSVSVRNRDE